VIVEESLEEEDTRDNTSKYGKGNNYEL